jgi:hypothetical protein
MVNVVGPDGEVVDGGCGVLTFGVYVAGGCGVLTFGV